MTAEQKQLIRATSVALNSQSAREISAYLLTRRTITMQSQRIVTKPPEQMTRETYAVGKIARLLELVTGNPANPVARIRAIAQAGGIVGIIEAVRAGKAANPAAAQEIDNLAAALDLLYAEHEREGDEWPIPEHFGAPTYTEPAISTVPGPTHWQHAFPGADIPTFDQIDSALHPEET